MTSSQLHIDLHAITDNYRLLDRQTGADTRTAAAVKADGYGLGMTAISKALYQAGCRMFFTAQLAEAVTLRSALTRQGYDGANITVLEGFDQPDLPDYSAHQLTPVINHSQQAEMLASYQRQTQAALPAILHIDTGMNRLGYGKDTRSLLADKDSGLQEIELQLVMSHLACSDDPSDDYNRYQLEQFTQLIQPFAHIPKSLCNSGGIFLPSDYHFQLTRPGIALYGSMPDPATPDSPLRPVLSWQADIVQIRTLQTGERAGYGGEFIARTPTRLATIAAGYADGYARALYQPDRGQIATVEIAGKIVPLAGRVSMDVLIADVTSLTDAELETADHACLLGPHYSLTEMATDLDTISYEILTGLGDRPARLYDGV
ncbi:MAG: alanine racemase [Candidatus Puniceispirillaceae bacterium]